MELDAATDHLVEQLHTIVGDGWSVITLRFTVQRQAGGGALTVTDLSADNGYAADSPKLFRRWGFMRSATTFLRAVGQASTGRRDGDLHVELVLHASGGRELSYHRGPAVALAAHVVFDEDYRYPNRRLDTPGPGPSDGSPTDPAVLAEVTELVRRFVASDAPNADFAPGRSEDEIAAVEAKLGARLPEDLRALYRVVGDDADKRGLLGLYHLHPLEALAHGEPLWGEDLFDPVYASVIFDARPFGHIRRLGGHRWWIPFGSDGGGNTCAVDLDPAPRGRVGQVLEHGRDFNRAVGYVAGSVLEMLADRPRPAPVNRQRFVDGPPEPDDDVQQLIVKRGADLDLTGLTGLPNLLEIIVNERTSVRAGVPAEVPLEALEITAGAIDLDGLAGHPTLWNLTLRGAEPVDIAVLQTLPALARLDLTDIPVADLAVLGSLPALRVLELGAGQWRELFEHGVRIPGLAGARRGGRCTPEEADDWERRIASLR